MKRWVTVAVGLLLACGGSRTGIRAEDAVPGLLYLEVTSTHLPGDAVDGASMDAHAADVDGDGDLDIIIAGEFESNILLINDGSAHFTDESAARLPRTFHDSEDIGVADFDGDGDLDIVVVSEDDQTNELYLNDGRGVFSDASSRMPVTGTSNAVLVAELTDDGAPDILIGNNGRDAFLVNDGSGFFADESAERLPGIVDITQDLELGDIDGDGDLDLVVGNEDANRVLINGGGGFFTDQTGDRLEARAAPEETREADLGDVDRDGDLDLLFANINAFTPGADPQNRLLVNDGDGFFTDQTATALPALDNRSFDADFVDVDRDGDLDIVSADSKPGARFNEPFRVFRNDGAGHFTEATAEVFPAGVVGKGFDVEAADFDGDGCLDFYLASRGSTDRLLLAVNCGPPAPRRPSPTRRVP